MELTSGKYDVSLVIDEPEKYFAADPPADYLLIKGAPRQLRNCGYVYIRNGSALVARVLSRGIETRGSRPERIGNPPGDRGPGPVLLVDPGTWESDIYYDLSENSLCSGQGLRYLVTHHDSSIQHYRSTKDEAMGEVIWRTSTRESSSALEARISGSDEEMIEGAKKIIETTQYRRNRKARDACIEKYGLECVCCGFDFEKTYGALGDGFIHVHHLSEISKSEGEYKIDVDDLRPLCPNCHSMIHRKKTMISISELMAIMEDSKK